MDGLWIKQKNLCVLELSPFDPKNPALNEGEYSYSVILNGSIVSFSYN